MSDNPKQSQQSGDNSRNYQAGRDIIINRSGDAQNAPTPPDIEKLSELRQHLIKSQSPHELQQGLYEVEAILEGSPKDTETRMLRDKYRLALRHASVSDICCLGSRAYRRSLLPVFLLMLAIFVTAFLVAFFVLDHPIWLSLFIAAGTLFALLNALAIVGAIVIGTVYALEWWRERKSNNVHGPR